MTYSEPLGNQISRFLDFVGLGFIFCGFYIAVKVLFRIFGKGKMSVMISDGIFCLLTAFVSFFCMVMENSGTVRFNLIIGQLIGGLTLYFTVGRFLLKLLYLIADAINCVLRGVMYPLRILIVSVVKLPNKLFLLLKGLFMSSYEKRNRSKTDKMLIKK